MNAQSTDSVTILRCVGKRCAIADPTGNLAQAALDYATRGWPVLPLMPGAKTPCIPKRDGGRGVHDATTDPGQIRTWWTRWPTANIGLGCGSLFWVLDVDYGGWEASEADGLTSLAALSERYGPLPPTVVQVTGGGGFQYLFTPDSRLKNGVKFLPGLDTRSTGGYIAAPPSTHPCGRTYRWRRAHGPGEIALAVAPAWLVALAEPVELPEPAASARQTSPMRASCAAYVEAALTRACDTIARASIGVQEATLARESYGIGRLVAGGSLPGDHARQRLVAAGAAMVSQPGRARWTRPEVDWRVGRAFAGAAAHPRRIDAR